MGISNSIISLILSNFNLTYLQTHAYTITFGYFFTALTLFLLAYFAQYIIGKYKKASLNNSSFELELQRSQVPQEQDEQLIVPIIHSTSSKTNKIYYFFNSNRREIINILSFSLYGIAIPTGGLAPAVLSGADIISLSTSILALLIYFSLSFLFLTAKYQTYISRPSATHNVLKSILQQSFSFRRTHPYLSLTYGLFALTYSTMVPISLSGLCLAYYNPKAGFEYGSFWASTRMTRHFYQPTPCPDNQICHIYSTLPEDPSTSVFINVHTGKGLDTIDIRYRQVEEDFMEEESITAQSYYLDIEDKAARYVHTAYLTNLGPATEYYIQVYYDNIFKEEAYFKTLPNQSMNKTVTIALGGDVGGTSTAEAIVNQLDTYDPDVIMLGGDLAYDNGNSYCYYTYDIFLNMFENLNKRLNRLVPLVLALGNHDIGHREYQFITVDKEKNLFFFYFPQHSKSNAEGKILQEVPSPNEREAYFYHKIGSTLHITLDSGYTNRYDGKQLEWLINVSQAHSNMPKYANYHVPIVPACYFGKMKIDQKAYLWAPVFETLRFAGVFENHMHLYKRTLPVKFNNETDSGVIYFGDGNWGVNAESCYDADDNKNRTGLFASLGKVSHTWIMKAGNQKAEYFAVNSEGEQLDNTFVQKLAKFKLKKIKAKSLLLLEKLKLKELEN